MKRAFFLCGLVVLACGCSEGIQKVTGKVTLDKKPLPDGEIMLVDSSGRAPIVLPIKAGSFEGEALAGKYRVEIRGYRLSAEPLPPGPGVSKAERVRENYLPDRFNTNSKATVEVKADGPNEFNFDTQTDTQTE